MSWFWLALIGPAVWAVSNHIDKYLVERFFRDRGVGALVIFSAVAGLLVTPIILFFQPEVVSEIGLRQLLMALAGAVFILGIILYLYAMESGEASTVASLFQLIPVFVLVFAYFFLGEILTTEQFVGGLLIVLGSVAISLSMKEGSYGFNRKVLVLMSTASLLLAANQTMFKKFALEGNFWETFFWGYVGVSVVGVLSFVFVTSYRKLFMDVILTKGPKIISLNILNEIIDIGANISFRYASLLAPLALVQMVNGFQPAFVFLYGILITIFFPSWGKESLAREHLLQKALSIAVMITGAVIIGW